MNADMLRVTLENGTPLGFIDITSETTLADARAAIEREVSGAPAAFTFLVRDGLPVSRAQEDAQSVASFLPSVALRPGGVPANRSAQVTVQGFAAGAPPLAVWTTPEYTFGEGH
jgi:hypothetical protein